MVSGKQVVTLGDIPCAASKFVFLSAEEEFSVKVGDLSRFDLVLEQSGAGLLGAPGL